MLIVHALSTHNVPIITYLNQLDSRVNKSGDPTVLPPSSADNQLLIDDPVSPDDDPLSPGDPPSANKVILSMQPVELPPAALVTGVLKLYVNEEHFEGEAHQPLDDVWATIGIFLKSSGPKSRTPPAWSSITEHRQCKSLPAVLWVRKTYGLFRGLRNALEISWAGLHICGVADVVSILSIVPDSSGGIKLKDWPDWVSLLTLCDRTVIVTLSLNLNHFLIVPPPPRKVGEHTGCH